MEVTVRDAAVRLGVSERQVQRLARSGRLQVVRRIGSTLLIDDTGLVRAGSATRGRIWAPTTAWAAIDLLEHGCTDRMQGSALSRLRGRLRECDAEDLVRLTGDRAVQWRGTQTRRSRAVLRGEMDLSGQTLLEDSEIANQFGLVAGPSRLVEGYVTADLWPVVMARFGLEPDGEGDVFIHVTDQRPTVGIISCALDLADHTSTRERSAGLRLLEDRLKR